MTPDWIKKASEHLESAGLLRNLKVSAYGRDRRLIINGRAAVDFAGNDYLGLRNHPDVISASVKALQCFGAGGGASRLISGNHPLYEILEKEIAGFKRYPAALVFNSGYALNLSVIPALAGKGDAVILDKLNHASLIDGAKLSGAKILVYPHADMDGLEKALKTAAKYKKRLIVTDTVFSMDGDIAPLKDIAILSRKYDAMLFADEAHATGVLGPKGSGVVEAAGLSGEVAVTMGTFSKALGSLGAYVVCDAALRTYLVNHARGLIYTTALPPSVLAASTAALAVAGKADDRRKRLFENSERLRQGLLEKGFDTGKSETPIVPVIIGDEQQTVLLTDALLKRGYYAPAIRFPTVKKGRARLRLTLSSEHTLQEIDGLIAALIEVVQ